MAALIASLTAVAAWIKIPFPLVPITLQTLFTYLAGCLLPSRMAFFSQAAVLCLGLLGVPVFAGGGGPHYLLQPTFGYLLAMPLAAYAIARTRGERQSIPRLVNALVVGTTVVFGLGVFWLYATMHLVLKQNLDLVTAMWSGCIIFLPGETIKGAAAIWLTQKYAKLAKESKA